MTVETIHVYHTNDVHSHLDHWSKIAHYIKQQRRIHELKNEEMLLFDIGDHADRVDSLTEGLKGKGNVTLLNHLGYHNVTIGNNEGITFAKTELNELYEEAAFPVLVANLFDQDGKRPHWAVPYDIHRLKNGITIGVIGVTIPFVVFYEKLGWKIVDPHEILPSLVREVREQADIVILLSHLGYGSDEQIASEIDGIDVILGAHTHHLLQQGRVVKGTLIAQAGRFGHYVGRLTLRYDKRIGELVEIEAACVPVANMKKDSATEQLLANLRAISKERLSEKVTELQEPLSISWFEESPFASLLAKSVKEWCGTDIAMINSGLLLDGLPAGEVTKHDLHRVCPHPINPCTVRLRGSELREIVRQALMDEMVRLELKGFGFRGKMLGTMIYEGMDVKTELLDNGKPYVDSITIKGEPLNLKKTYLIATVDMFTFGRLYPAIAQAKEKNYFLPEMLRDVLAWKLG